MLRIIIGEETFNDETKEFSIADPVVLDLEHSLISVSKWESKHQKPFLSSGKKTPDEIYDYLKCMVVTPNADPDALNRCSQENLDAIQQYIDSSESATTFGSMPERRGPAEVITSELIYYWMLTFNVPAQFESWHLNRLFALIRICNVKNSPPKKMSQTERALKNREINEQRKKQFGTRG